jgi:hypothetical protein
MRNAVEAMAASDRCDLEVKTSLFDDATIEISVADSGPGLSPEVANHLFEPFIFDQAPRHGARSFHLPIDRGGEWRRAADPPQSEWRSHLLFHPSGRPVRRWERTVYVVDDDGAVRRSLDDCWTRQASV